MIYAMSDIHGKYDRYIAMLEKIKFSDEDSLFILGDVVDRGEDPIKVLKDMMERPNVFPIMGNHDLLALQVLRKLSVEITAENYDCQINSDDMQMLIDWMNEGGAPTIEQFRRLPVEECEDILNYIAEFSMYDTIDVGEKTFILVHAGLGNFRPDKKLSEYTQYELMMMRTDPFAVYFEDESVFIVSGHTPTYYFSGKSEILITESSICIDCGACFSHGKLACICLDTMEEFYV
ncbi:MAG: fructose-bisphosphatase class III [Oscillospiraceae bacterium]|nr:fructose-bisphosphatase class III [Oscillospiraceae bacterium]